MSSGHINIFQFPYLIQIAILTNFDYNQIFLFALCSKKSKLLIRLILRLRCHSIKNIDLKNRYDDIQVNAVDREGNATVIVTIKSRVKFREPGTPVRISGMLMDFIIAPDYLNVACDCPFRIAASNKRHTANKIVDRIHDYIYDLFGDLVGYRTYFSYFRCHSFPKPKRVTSSEFHGSSITGPKLNEYLSALPDQKFVKLYCHDVAEPLDACSKVFSADMIDIREHQLRNILDILRNFSGRRAFLSLGGRVDGLVLNAQLSLFLRMWQTMKAYHNVELLTFTVSPFVHEFNLKAFKYSVSIKHYPESRKPLHYSYERGSCLNSDIKHVRCV